MGSVMNGEEASRPESVSLTPVSRLWTPQLLANLSHLVLILQYANAIAPVWFYGVKIKHADKSNDYIKSWWL